MYDFSTKKKLKKRAQVGHIQTYRVMLSERQVPASGWVAINPQELAEDLLYILLDYYSIEEIEARASGAVPAADHFRDATKMILTFVHRCAQKSGKPFFSGLPLCVVLYMILRK